MRRCILSELPDSIAIVGAGYIALEFATIFVGLGVDVSVLYRGPQILRGFDEDIRNGLADELGKRGVNNFGQHRNHHLLRRTRDGYVIDLKDGNQSAQAKGYVCHGTGAQHARRWFA